MTENPFPVLAIKHFDFLSATYNFTLQEIIGIFGKTIVYQSPKLVIEICEDRSSIFVFLKPVGEPEIAQLELLNVFEALSVFVPPGFQGPVAPAQYEKVLEFYAQTLRQYCLPFIKGDFSTWTKVLKYHLTWMKNRYGKKLPSETYSDLENYIKVKEIVK
jgi:hypothetical protein